MRLTPKQERFALAYVEIGSASAAYRIAYSTERMKPATINRRAFDLLGHGKIKARVEALQAEARGRHRVTVDSLSAQALEAHEGAMKSGQYGAAVAALGLLAKIHGLLVDRHTVEAQAKSETIISVRYINPDEQTTPLLENS